MVSLDTPVRPPAPEQSVDTGGRANGRGALVAAVALGLLAVGVVVGVQPGADGWEQTGELLSGLRDHLVTSRPVNLAAPFVALAFVAWCALLGVALLRLLRVELDRLEELTLGAVLGAFPAMVVILSVGTVIGLATPTLLLTGAATGLAALAVLVRVRPVIPRRPLSTAVRAARPTRVQLALLVALAVLLVVPFLGSLETEANWDGRWYHLGPASHYVENGSFYNTVAETGMAVTALPSYDETLRTGLFGIRGEVPAKALSFAQLVVVLGLLVACARRFLGDATVGLVAGVGLCAVPVATWAATASYVDLAAGMVTLAMFYAALRHRAAPSWRWLVLLGVLGGYVIGVKYYGAFGVVGCGLVALWPPRFDRAAVTRVVVEGVQLGAAVLVGWAPGLVRSGVQTGNPVFPLLPGVFSSQYWSVDRQAESLDGLRPISLLELPIKLVRLPYDTVVDADRLNTLVGPAFLVLLPLVVVAALVLGRRRRAAPGVLLPAGFVCLVWVLAWLKLGLPDSRYLLAIMPIAAFALAGLAASVRWSRAPAALGACAVVFAVVVVLGSPYCDRLLRQADPNVAAGAIPLRIPYLYEGRPAAFYTEPDDVRVINEVVPADGKVMIMNGMYTFYLEIHPEVLAYSDSDGPPSVRAWSACNADAPWRMKAAGVTHVLIEAKVTSITQVAVGKFLHPVSGVTKNGSLLYAFDAAAVGPEPADVDHTFCS